MTWRSFLSAGACAALTSLLGCTAGAPRIVTPSRVEAYCGSKQARPTGIASVLTSTDDKLLDDAPTVREIRRAVGAGDGVIVYWNEQRLKLPEVAASLGENDGYARVRSAAIPVAPQGAPSRHIYLLVRAHGGQRWITLRAFDVQDVCVEGKPEA